MTTTISPSTSPVPAFLASEGDRILNDDGTLSIITCVVFSGRMTVVYFVVEGGSKVREMRVRSDLDLKMYND